MSVIYFDKSTFILCHLKWLNESSIQVMQLKRQNKQIDMETGKSYLECSFNITTPFFMDGEARKIAEFMRKNQQESEAITLEQFFVSKGKLDLKCSENQIIKEREMLLIEEHFTKLKSCTEFKNYFNYINLSGDYENNNGNIRNCREKVTELTDYSLRKQDFYNDSKDYIIYNIDNHEHLIPPKSRFICEDARSLMSYFNGNTFEYIVIDPPWRNRHVRRKKKLRGINHSYDTLTIDEIMKIPIQSIINNNSIVFIWITNNDSINEEFKQKIHIWDLEIIATWYWLKLTKSGELVVHPSVTKSRGKFPYEKLIVAKNKHKEGVTIPKDVLIASVPSGMHSYKPPLNEVISSIFGENKNGKCLEIFARSLIPGWTSLGLEVLKFQNAQLLNIVES